MKKTLYLIIGCLLMACAVNFIVVPNEIIAGGISGFATVLQIKFGLNKDIVILICNTVLLIYAFFFLSKKYATGSFLGSIIIFPLFLYLIPEVKIINDQLLAAICCGILAGSGVFFLYLSGGSTGGTTIVGMIIHKYSSINYGPSVALADGIIVLFGLIAFGLESSLYALVSIVAMSVTTQYLESGIKQVKVVHILTYSPLKTLSELEECITNIKTVSTSNNLLVILVKVTELKKVKKYTKENNLSLYTTTASSTYGEALTFFENAGK